MNHHGPWIGPLLSRRAFLTLSAWLAWPLHRLFLRESDAALVSRPSAKDGPEPAPRKPPGNIADALVIKNEDLFFLTQADGQIPRSNNHGLGLYFHDCRYLSGYELKLADSVPQVLGGTAGRGFLAKLQLGNSAFRTADGRTIAGEDILIQWHRVLEGRKPALHDVLVFHNFGLQRAAFSVALTFDATFEDVFVVRDLEPPTRGRLHKPTWRDGVLGFVYDGEDGVFRSLSVQFLTSPDQVDGATAVFDLQLDPQQSTQLHLDLVVAESKNRPEVEPSAHRRPDLQEHESHLEAEAERWLNGITRVSSDHFMVQWAMQQALRGLLMLRSVEYGNEFFAAGIPWFATLFGRDSLISGLQTLAYAPDISAQTLRLLARFQGQRVDDWRDEEPGKILHELRVGEMARLGNIPQTPYYGSIDATPLFLILLGRHAAWTGDLGLFAELQPQVDRALAWMSWEPDGRTRPYLTYSRRSNKGLTNQGWKDSSDAIVHPDGRAAVAPIALVEVQGYVYAAKLAIADLYARAGSRDRAERLRREAEDLRNRFNHDFWMPDETFYAVALEQHGDPVRIVTSNPGQALWTGIVDPDKAALTIRRLLAPDMFSGWGIRTLSTNEAVYNPLGYHRGTVWPHDNSIIVDGLRRYGYDEAALQIFESLTHAAIHFPGYQLPEVFSGFDRREYDRPISYPVACHPQAWAAGALPYMMQSLLGLVPEAFDRRLRIVRPLLPRFLQHVEIQRLRVGKASVDLRFDRAHSGAANVRILKSTGELDVVVEPDTAPGHHPR